MPSHPFTEHPHGSFLWLTLPVLVSLVAEPIAGLIDAAFIARLGSLPLAALGIGTSLLSGVLWIFNFLSIGTQTEIGRNLGAGNTAAARRALGSGLGLAIAIAVAVTSSAWLFVDQAVEAMGAHDEMARIAVDYLQIRLFGVPAVLLMMVGFGALRGIQDMRSPLWIATTTNLLNAGLDAALISGAGSIPAFGVSGAAAGTVISQWLGACWVVVLLSRKIGLEWPESLSEVRALLKIGSDLFVRTGMLFLFLIMGTRTATRIGADAGAVHHAIRQIWMLAALLLDSFAITAQSLVSYFIGAGDLGQARRVAKVACQWALVSGVLLLVTMLIGSDIVNAILVPTSAQSAFWSPWVIAAMSQPVNALSFATDGIHWGTGDYGFLRNVMIVSTMVGLAGLQGLELLGQSSLSGIWILMTMWVAIRAVFGVMRVWPGPSRRMLSGPLES